MSITVVREAPQSPSTPAIPVLTAVDPATGQTIGTVKVTSEDRIPEIVARSRKAQQKWAALPFTERARTLSTLRAVVVKRASEIAETVSRGMGKPLVEALADDVGLVLDEFDEYIQHGAEYLADEPVEISPNLGRTRRRSFVTFRAAWSASSLRGISHLNWR